MNTVILSEYNIPTENKHIFSHGIHRGEALQYYGGNTGILIHWTPTCRRIQSCERVRVDTVTPQYFNPWMKNPYYRRV